MSEPPPVLVVSTVLDLATDRVVDILNGIGTPVIRLNTEDHPYRQMITMDPSGTIELRGAGVAARVLTPRSVWYRRLRSSAPPEGVDASLHAYVSVESAWSIRSAVELVGPNARWMSRPSAIDIAEMKPVQLQVAKNLGLRIPRTIVSSDPVRIADFASAAQGRSVVGKALRHGYIEFAGDGYAMYTRRLDRDDIEALTESLPCPIIVQVEEPKLYDVRVTVVGHQIFAALIDSQADEAAIVDWRRTERSDLAHLPHELPERIANQCLLLTQTLGLTFAAIDFVLRPDDEYVFLEVNPAGQWLWIEDQLGYPISQTVAEWLTN